MDRRQWSLGSESNRMFLINVRFGWWLISDLSPYTVAELGCAAAAIEIMRRKKKRIIHNFF
jgi:hypothetical protein